MLNQFSLLHRLHKLLGDLDPYVTSQPSAPSLLDGAGYIPMLSTSELALLKAFIAQVEPKIKMQGGHMDMSGLSIAELDEALAWSRLRTALRRGDTRAIERLRAFLCNMDGWQPLAS